MRQLEKSHNSRMLLLVSALALVLAACGGSGGTPDPTGGPGTTAGGSSQPTTGGTSSPETTQPPPSGGGEGSLVVEFDGNRHEFPFLTDMPVAGIPGYTVSTSCATNFFNRGLFWVIAFMPDDDGVAIPDYQMSVGIYPDGRIEETHDSITIPIQGERVEYEIDKDDPGSWTISGNRASGELNLTHAETSITATFDFNCPPD